MLLEEEISIQALKNYDFKKQHKRRERKNVEVWSLFGLQMAWFNFRVS